MNHRIGFAGASGTGKTWLATRLAVERGLPLCPVGSRQIAQRMGYASPYDVDAVPGARRAFQVELQRAKTEWEREQGWGGFVSDRTPIDNLAYTALHDVHAISADMLELTRSHFATYTHVVVCWRSSFCQLGTDPARALDPTYQAVYEACLYGLLLEHTSPKTRVLHLTEPDEDPLARLSRVRTFVDLP